MLPMTNIRTDMSQAFPHLDVSIPKDIVEDMKDIASDLAQNVEREILNNLEMAYVIGKNQAILEVKANGDFTTPGIGKLPEPTKQFLPPPVPVRFDPAPAAMPIPKTQGVIYGAAPDGVYIDGRFINNEVLQRAYDMQKSMGNI